MKMRLFFLLFILLLVERGMAAKRYWVGNGSNFNWNTTANWSATSGGSSGASVPGTSDTAYFNGSGTGKCKLDTSISIKRMEILSGYSDTVFQNKYPITIGTSGFSQTGGTFYGDSTDITINGTFSMTAGKFRSTKSTLSCAGDFTASVNIGTFLHNNGKIKFTSSGTIFGPGSIHMYDVELNTSSSIAVTIYGSVAAYADHDLSYTGSGAITLTWGSFHVYGDLYLNSATSGGGGTGAIFMEGTANQTVHGGTAGFNSGRTPNLYFTKAAGTLSLTDNICVVSTTFSCTTTVTAGSSTVNFYGTTVLSGSVSLNNVVFTGLPSYTHIIFNSSTDTLTVNGSMYLEGNQGVNFDSGNINVKGDIYCNSTTVSGGGDASININGTGSQTIYGASVEGNSPLSRIKINKSSDTLSLTGFISVDREWTLTAGTVSSGTSTVVFTRSGPTINGKQALNNVTFSPTSTSSTVTVSDSLTVANLTFKGGTYPITVNTGVISVTGNITNNNTSGGGGGSGQINITGTGSQTLTTTSTGTAVPGAFCNVAINKTGGTLTLSNNINAGNSWTYAATSTTLTPGSSTVMFTGTTYTIGGTHTLNNVSVAPSSTAAVTATVSNALTVPGTLTFSGNAAVTINTGTINATGNITVTNTVATGGGSALLNINGSGSQTLTGTSVSTALPLCDLLINKSAGTLTVTGTSLSAGGSVTCITGTTVVNSSNTLYLYGTSSINATAVTFNHVSVNSGTRSLGSNLSLAGNLSVPTSTATLDASGGNYAINLQGNWSNSGHFKSGTGYVNFTGTNNQTITQPVSASDSIAKLGVNKSAGTLTLSSVVTVSDSLKFTSGNLTSDTTNLLVLWRRATASGMSNSAFVNGPVKKIGSSAFTFPTGKGSDYQPIAITAPSSSTDAYVGEYFNTGQTYGSATGDSIAGISTCEYWNLNRAAGTSTVSVTLGWNSSSCTADTTINMRIANWNGSQWNNLGGVSPTGDHTTGTITSLPVALTSLPAASYVHLVLARFCNISVSISSSVPADTLCIGDSLTLTANPAGVTLYPINSYTWTNSNNGTTASTQTLSVNATGNYTVTASNSIGCSIAGSVTITAIPLVTVNSATVFISETATLTASGATSYTWTPSTALDTTAGATVHSNPTTNMVYTVTGTTNGCSFSATSTVIIVPDSMPPATFVSCNCTGSFFPQKNKKYLVSAWVRESGASPTVTSFTNPVIYIDFADGSRDWVATSGPFYATGNIIDGWQRIEGTFIMPSTAFYILLRLESNSGDALFDDIRVFPYDASMKSYVYDPVTMRLVAELDERNYATQYEYDEEGKLIRVKKETERGIMTIKEDRNSSVKR